MSKPRYIFCISSEVDYIKQCIDKHNPELYSLYTFWANEELPENFWNSINTGSLLSKKKMITLRNTHKLNKEDFVQIAKIIQNNTDIFCIFCIEQDNIPTYIKEHSLYIAAQKNGHSNTQTLLTRKNISEYIQNYCKSKGYTIEISALNYIKNCIACNTASIHNECDKYMLYTDTNNITLDTVEKTMSYTIEYSIWSILENLLQKRNILDIWQEATQNTSFFLLSAVLQKELRTLCALLCGDPVYIPDYHQQKKIALAKKLSLYGIAKIIGLLTNAENNIKAGIYTEKQALEYILCTVPYTIT